MTSFLTTLYPTMIALFETEPTTEIHHRLLLNHINRHLDTWSNRYHNHHRRRLILSTAAAASPQSSTRRGGNALVALEQHNQYLRLNFRILIRFIGTLVQTDLLSANDLDIITRQRIQFFFLTFQQVVSSVDDDEPVNQKKSRVKHQHQEQQIDTTTAIKSFKRNKNHYCWKLWLEEIEFQLEIFLDLTRAILLSQQQGQQQSRASTDDDLNTVSTLLGNTISALISTRSNNSNNQQVPDISATITTKTTTTSATTAV
jgi:hypothetical protein